MSSHSCSAAQAMLRLLQQLKSSQDAATKLRVLRKLWQGICNRRQLQRVLHLLPAEEALRMMCSPSRSCHFRQGVCADVNKEAAVAAHQREETLEKRAEAACAAPALCFRTATH